MQSKCLKTNMVPVFFGCHKFFTYFQTPGGFRGEWSLETLEVRSEVSDTAVGALTAASAATGKSSIVVWYVVMMLLG